EPNTTLLEELRDLTGGRSYSDDAEELARVARSGEVFRAGLALTKSLQPIWFWLVFVSCILLLFDVAVRRIAVDPVQVIAVAHNLWDKMRGTTAPRQVAEEFIDRLRSRKAQVGQALDQGRAARRFEGTEGATAVAPPGAEEARPMPERRPPSRASQPAPPTVGEESEDSSSRLMLAKRRAMKDRDKRGEA